MRTDIPPYHGQRADVGARVQGGGGDAPNTTLMPRRLSGGVCGLRGIAAKAPWRLPPLAWVLLAAVLLSLAGPSDAQPAHPNGSSIEPPTVAVPPSLRREISRRFLLERFTVQQPTVRAQAGGELRTSLLVGDERYTLSLHPSDVRAPRFRVLVDDGTGRLRDAAPPPPTTFSGTLLENPGSVAAALWENGQLTAVIRLANGDIWSVQPVGAELPTAPRSWHVVFRDTDAEAGNWACGTTEHQPAIANAGTAAVEDVNAAAGGGPWFVAEVAFEADFEFFELNGSSVDATVTDIESVLNGVNVIYENDVGITHRITTVLVRTAEPDPYTETNDLLLLEEFRDEWNSNQEAIVRDVAHLMTGKNLDGNVVGIAYLAKVCFDNSYGLSQSRFRVSMPDRVALTAHELGHSWSADHCDADGDCSIMCSTLGGCTGNITSFGSTTKASISAWRGSLIIFSDCLDVLAIDVALRAVDIASPTAPEEGALPAGMGTVCPGRDFYVEVWVSQVNGGSDGIAGGSVDLLFDAATVTATSIDHGSVFNNPSNPDAISAGLVDDLGGATTLAGKAVGPNWALLARVAVTVTGSGPFTFSMDNGALAFALAGGMPPLDDVKVDVSATLTVTVASVDDGNACTDDVCDAATGLVAHTNVPRVTVDVEIDALDLAPATVTRDVSFLLTECAGSTVEKRVEPVTFVGRTGTAVLDNIDPAAQWINVREGHTLSRLASLTFDICDHATVDLTGANRLLSGDFQTSPVPQDDLVDVTDLSILSTAWFDSIVPTLSIGADATGDGVQDTADYTALVVNATKVSGAPDGCPGGRSSGGVVESQPIAAADGSLCDEVAAGDPPVIQLSLGTRPRSIDVGARFEIDLVVASAEPTWPYVSIAAMDVVITWDPVAIELLAVEDSGPYDWQLASPPETSLRDPLNDSFLDGDMRFTALARLGDPAVATPQGLKAATLQFVALAETTTSGIVIEPTFGESAVTRVFGADCANQILNTTLHSTSVSIIPPQDCEGAGVSDLREFFYLQSCYTGPVTSLSPGDPPAYSEDPGLCCAVFDRDDDGDVDDLDYAYFVGLMQGP